MKKIPNILYGFALTIILTPAKAQNDTLKVQSAPSLHQLIGQALQNSEGVSIQEALTRKAALDMKRAKQTYLPSITSEATYTHLNDAIMLPQEMQQLLMGTQSLLVKEALGVPFNSPLPADVSLKPVTPIQQQNFLKANVNGQMVLFTGGQAPLAAKAAKHQQRAQRHLTAKEKSNVVKEVVKHYDQFAVVLRSEEVLLKTEQRLQEQRRFVEGAIKNGLATPLERERVNLAQQQLEARQIELETSKELLLAKLSQLTGADIEALGLAKPDLVLWQLQTYTDSPDQRPELQAMEEGIKALEYKRKAELAAYTPKVAAFGRRELNKEGLSALDPVWFVGVGVKWNMFDGLSASNKAQQTKLDQLVLEQRKLEAAELLELNLDKAKAEARKTMKLVKVSEQQTKTSERVYTTSQKQYELGLITLNDHLSSVTELETAELEQLKAVYQQRLAMLELLEAVGALTPESIPAH